jgi:hypothetical protein
MRFLLIIFLFCGCSSSKPNFVFSNEMKVSVSSDGKAVTDIDKELVHRVTVSSAILAKITKNIDLRDLPFLVQAEFNSKAEFVGMRLFKYRGGFAYGLEEQDLITAVGKTKLQERKHLLLMFDALNQTGETSLSIVRRGEAQKILLYRGK